jgi:hypothetical protein
MELRYIKSLNPASVKKSKEEKDFNSSGKAQRQGKNLKTSTIFSYLLF